MQAMALQYTEVASARRLIFWPAGVPEGDWNSGGWFGLFCVLAVMGLLLGKYFQGVHLRTQSETGNYSRHAQEYSQANGWMLWHLSGI